jgi:hypothetical protein
VIDGINQMINDSERIGNRIKFNHSESASISAKTDEEDESHERENLNEVEVVDLDNYTPVLDSQ